MTRLQVVGGGRMGGALVAGLLEAGWAAADELAVVEPVDARRQDLAARFPGLAVVPEPVSSSGTVLAVKPADVPGAAAAVVAAGTRQVLSIAAGVTLSQLEAALGDPPPPTVRAMPNTPALVGAGAAAISGGSRADESTLAWAESVLGAVGTVVRVPEHLLDAVTGLSGSGPAYLFLVAEALVEAGVLAGLPRDVAEVLAHHTVLGAGRLLVETDDGAPSLRADVTSPGGTTAAGLRALEEHGVRAAFLAAVDAARRRSVELGQP